MVAQRILELLAEFRKCATETTAPAILSTQTFPRGSFPALFLFCGHCVPRSWEDYPVKFIRQTFPIQQALQESRSAFSPHAAPEGKSGLAPAHA